MRTLLLCIASALIGAGAVYMFLVPGTDQRVEAVSPVEPKSRVIEEAYTTPSLSADREQAFTDTLMDQFRSAASAGSLASFYDTFSDSDAKAAWAFAKEQGLQDAWVRTIMGKLFVLDPAFAVEEANELPRLLRRAATLGILYAVPENTTLRERFDIAQSLRFPKLFLEGKSDIGLAWEEASNLESFLDATFLRAGVVAQWIEQDPAAAFAALHALEPNHPLSKRAKKAFTEWAIDDPNAALDWVLTNDLKKGRSGYLRAAIQALVSYDLEQAQQRMDWLEPEDRRQLLPHFIGLSMLRDPEATLAYIDTQDAELRAGALMVAATLTFTHDPARGHQLLAELPPEMRSGTLHSVGDAAGMSPDLLGPIVDGLNDEGERRVVRTAAIRKWARGDLEGARAYVDSLPAGERLGSMSEIMKVWNRRDADAAAEYAFAIEDEDVRQEALGKVARANAPVERNERVFQELTSVAHKISVAAVLKSQLEKSDPEKSSFYADYIETNRASLN